MYVVSPESPYYYNTTILVDDITTVLSGYGSAYAGEGALRLRLRLCRSLLGERALLEAGEASASNKLKSAGEQADSPAYEKENRISFEKAERAAQNNIGIPEV